MIASCDSILLYIGSYMLIQYIRKKPNFPNIIRMWAEEEEEKEATFEVSVTMTSVECVEF